MGLRRLFQNPLRRLFQNPLRRLFQNPSAEAIPEPPAEPPTEASSAVSSPLLNSASTWSFCSPLLFRGAFGAALGRVFLTWLCQPVGHKTHSS